MNLDLKKSEFLKGFCNLFALGFLFTIRKKKYVLWGRKCSLKLIMYLIYVFKGHFVFNKTVIKLVTVLIKRFFPYLNPAVFLQDQKVKTKLSIS